MGTRFGCFGPIAILLTSCILGLDAGDARAAAVTWVGDGVTNAWDTASPNWTGASFFYADGDDVTFDDSGSNAPDIAVDVGFPFGLAPGSVTVNNGAGHDYVFAGAGALTGLTGITKNGDGMLTVNNANDFAGVVNVSGGTLRLGNVTALGDPAGGTFVNAGGTLDLFNKVLPSAEMVTVAAGGTVVNNYATGASTFAQIDSLTLTGDATFGGTERIEIRGTPVFNGHTLTVIHSGNGVNGTYDAVRITNVATHDLLDANVVQGTLAFHNSGLGDPTGTITITHNPAATYVTMLQLMDSDATNGYVNDVTKNLSFTGGKLENFRGQFTIHGAVTLDDLATDIYVHTPGTFSTGAIFADAITGTGGITKTGSGPLTLQGVNTYSGNTTINGNKLILGESASIANSPVINVLGASSTFDVSAVAGGFTLAAGQTLMGRGAVAGSVAAASGSTVEGGSDGIGSLDFLNNLDMFGGANVTWQLGTLTDDLTGVAGTDFDQLGIAGNLILGGTSQLTLDFDLLVEEDRPGFATPDEFWANDRTWKIVDVAGGAGSETTGNFSLVVNGTFAVGAFAASVVDNDVFLNFDADFVPQPPIPGDADGNRIVDAVDAAIVAQNWLAGGLAGKAAVGDFNEDGSVDDLDLAILAANWGDHTGGGTASVPEPSTIVLLLGALALLLASRLLPRDQ